MKALKNILKCTEGNFHDREKEFKKIGSNGASGRIVAEQAFDLEAGKK